MNFNFWDRLYFGKFIFNLRKIFVKCQSKIGDCITLHVIVFKQDYANKN